MFENSLFFIIKTCLKNIGSDFYNTKATLCNIKYGAVKSIFFFSNEHSSLPSGPIGLHMSVSNRVFHAPRSDTDDRGYLRGEGCVFFFIYLWRRGRVVAGEGGVNARPFFHVNNHA